MFPDIPLENFHYIGNSSQTGAYAMLLAHHSKGSPEEITPPRGSFSHNGFVQNFWGHFIVYHAP